VIQLSGQSLQTLINALCDSLRNPQRGIASLGLALRTDDFEYSWFLHKQTPDGGLAEDPSFGEFGYGIVPLP
jgi:hypothetical protein